MNFMKTAAVISEFNPFHAGHALLLRKIRLSEGEDTAILCIMSGNYTQRGEAAVICKQSRAAAAIEGGADLVLELPFPYCCAGAERFAQAAVRIANAVQTDLLAFGAECEDTDRLFSLAAKIEAQEFRNAYASLCERNGIGCAAKIETVYRALYGKEEDLSILRQPNNLLGIEYIRAILRENAPIKPVAFRREGAAHGTDTLPKDGICPSAEALRKILGTGDIIQREMLRMLMPSCSADILQKEISERKSTADNDFLMRQLLLYYQLAPVEAYLSTDGMTGGLAHRVRKFASTSADPSSFFSALRTKRYTDAYLRRALLCGFFGLTRDMLNAPPLYTQVLAMNDRGCRLLASLRRKATISILTKPAAYRHLPHDAFLQANRTLRADTLYASLFRLPLPPSDLLRYLPYRKTDRIVTTS